MRLKALICPLVLPLGLATVNAAQAKDVSVTSAQVQKLEIKVADVRKAATEAVALLPGTVVPALNARMVAAARRNSLAGSRLAGSDSKKG